MLPLHLQHHKTVRNFATLHGEDKVWINLLTPPALHGAMVACDIAMPPTQCRVSVEIDCDIAVVLTRKITLVNRRKQATLQRPPILTDQLISRFWLIGFCLEWHTPVVTVCPQAKLYASRCHLVTKMGLGLPI